MRVCESFIEAILVFLLRVHRRCNWAHLATAPWPIARAIGAASGHRNLRAKFPRHCIPSRMKYPGQLALTERTRLALGAFLGGARLALERVVPVVRLEGSCAPCSVQAGGDVGEWE